MSLRIFSAALLLALAACSKETTPDPVASAAADNRIDCATGNAPLTKDCAVEQSGDVMTIRRADGSFRRLIVTADGQIEAADGADAADVQADGTVRVGEDRYRLSQ